MRKAAAGPASAEARLPGCLRKKDAAMLDVQRNLTTLTDFYELTMSAGYFEEGYQQKTAVFDMFFRRVPDGGGYAIMAGLQ